MSLATSTHSVEGAVNWSFFTSTGQGGPTHGDGFGVHDFAVKTSNGNNPALIETGEFVTFVFDFTSGIDLTMMDFTQPSEQPEDGGGHIETLATVKFVQGESLTNPLGGNDSGFRRGCARTWDHSSVLDGLCRPLAARSTAPDPLGSLASFGGPAASNGVERPAPLGCVAGADLYLSAV